MKKKSANVRASKSSHGFGRRSQSKTNIKDLKSLALKAIANKEYEFAIDYLQQHLEKSQDDAESLMNLAVALSITRNDDEARKAYQAVLAISPNHLLARKNLAILEWLAGNLEEAESQLEVALEIEPGCIKTRIDIATLYHLRGFSKKAIVFLQHPSAIQDSFQLALLIQILLDISDYPLAEQYLDLACNETSALPEFLMLKIQLSAATNRSEDVETDLNKLTQLGSLDALQLSNMARILNKYDAYHSMIPALFIESGLNWRESEECIAQYAFYLCKKGDVEQAEAILKPHLNGNCHNFEILRAAGITQESQGNYIEAITFYKKAQVLNGKCIDTLSKLCELYHYLGDICQVIKFGKRSAIAEPIGIMGYYYSAIGIGNID